MQNIPKDAKIKHQKSNAGQPSDIDVSLQLNDPADAATLMQDN